MRTEEQKELARQRTKEWYQANKERAKAKSVAWARANRNMPIEQRAVARVTDAEVARKIIKLLVAKFELESATDLFGNRV